MRGKKAKNEKLVLVAVEHLYGLCYHFNLNEASSVMRIEKESRKRSRAHIRGAKK